MHSRLLSLFVVADKDCGTKVSSPRLVSPARSLVMWLPGAMVARLASIAQRIPKGCRFESCGGHFLVFRFWASGMTISGLKEL